MKPYNGFEAKYSEGGAREKLPAGCYVGKILGVKLDSSNYGDSLVLQLDVTEGEHTGFFMKDYEASKDSQYGAKFRGILRMNVPKDDGSEKDGIVKRSFNSSIGAVERSNSGYKWNWNEQSLKGLAIGFTVRERDYYYNGNEGTTTEIAYLCPVDKVRDGSQKLPKKRELSEKDKAQKEQDRLAAGITQTDATNGMTAVDTDEELPF